MVDAIVIKLIKEYAFEEAIVCGVVVNFHEQFPVDSWRTSKQYQMDKLMPYV